MLVLEDLGDGNYAEAASGLQSQDVFSDQVDQALARIDIGASNHAYWTLLDRQNSVRDVIDNSATLKDSIAYDGFGSIQFLGSGLANASLVLAWLVGHAGDAVDFVVN